MMLKDDSVSVNKATGFYAYNGMICVGDHVEYEDGWLTFRTKIVEQNNVYGFFLDGEFFPLAKFISDMSAGDMKIRDCAEIDFTIINPSQKGKPAKVCLSIRNCIKRAPKSTVPSQHRFGFEKPCFCSL